MTVTTSERTRRRLAIHLRNCGARQGECLSCDAARLAESLPDTESADVRPVLEDMLATVERAAKEMDEVIVHLDGENGATMHDALHSIAVTTDSGALTAILARAACGPDTAEAALGKARERLDRIRILHAQLVDEHQNNPSILERLSLSNLRADIIRRLSQAWHGHLPANPFQPLSNDK